ncbi:ABC transporter substrate-binding protein [Geminicoccus harenae]|uniref:ABC transporter substrate-binding protein n=1 Tax=Geminicoccus harenae TaxID=2498453 RepID=UPI00168BE509|nr:ABC transporter substrate-binding protein [Geminicoccus harenae]
MQRRHVLGAMGLGSLLLAPAVGVRAATDIRFALDWDFQGPNVPFLIAEARGYFAAEGLSVRIDRSRGSADAVTRVASGVYQMGFADINRVIEFSATHPRQLVKAVMMIYDAAALGIYALPSSGIVTPADLAGRKLGGPATDASFRLFPAFATHEGLDPASVTRIDIDVERREAMLLQGEVDVISGYYFSVMLKLADMGVDPRGVVVMLYKDHGLDFYGNAVIASERFIAEQPDAVAAFNRAVARAMQDLMADPYGVIEMVHAHHPHIDAELEKQRLTLALAVNILTTRVWNDGFGDVDPARLARSIDQLAGALSLEQKPTVDMVWTDRFLPAPSARRLGG